jgi:hypothetical protein
MLKSTIDVEIDLPTQVIELKPKIEIFNSTPDRNKRYTEWFVLCSKVPSLQNWNNRSFIDNRINITEFTRCAGRAYSGLFQLEKQDFQFDKPSTVIKKAKVANELKTLIHNNAPLPCNSKDLDHIPWLNEVSTRCPSDIPRDSTSRGKPIIRWLIIKLAEEFCYSFDSEPTNNIISDLVKLGWPLYTDRSIRNILTKDSSLNALNTARLRRENDHDSIVITHQLLSALPSTSKGVASNQIIESTVSNKKSDKEILELIMSIANTLNDESSKFELISLINVLQYEKQDYLEDFGN